VLTSIRRGILQQLSHPIAIFPKPVIWSRAWMTARIPDLIASITPDVMASLRRSRFFG